MCFFFNCNVMQEFISNYFAEVHAKKVVDGKFVSSDWYFQWHYLVIAAASDGNGTAFAAAICLTWATIGWEHPPNKPPLWGPTKPLWTLKPLLLPLLEPFFHKVRSQRKKTILFGNFFQKKKLFFRCYSKTMLVNLLKVFGIGDPPPPFGKSSQIIPYFLLQQDNSDNFEYSWIMVKCRNW